MTPDLKTEKSLSGLLVPYTYKEIIGKLVFVHEVGDLRKFSYMLFLLYFLLSQNRHKTNQRH